jgi:hypothetical protein
VARAGRPQIAVIVDTDEGPVLAHSCDMIRYGLAAFLLVAAACGGAVNDQSNGVGGGANAGGAGGGAGATGGSSGATGGASGGSVVADAANDAPPKVCSSGQEISCSCGGGRVGVQFCSDDGTAYGSCQLCVSLLDEVGGYSPGAAGMGGSGGSGALGGSGGADAGNADASGRDADGSTDADAAPPTEMPSRQSVTFNLHNNGATEKWVVTKGQRCTPFAIGGVELVPPYNCACECPAPPPLGATYFTHVAPNETLTVTWDARQLVEWETAVDCATRGWPGIAGSELHYVMQPVAAGSYRATFGYETAMPPVGDACSASGQDYSCSLRQLEYFGVQEICGSTKTAVQDFTLSADGGAVSVDVNLN